MSDPAKLKLSGAWLLVGILFFCGTASAQGRRNKPTREFDRLGVAESLVQALYPPVYESWSSGVLTIQTVEFPSAEGSRRPWDTLYFSFVRCRASGVPGGSLAQASQLPGCGAAMLGSEALNSRLLRGSIRLKGGRFNVESFLATGDLVDLQLSKLEAELAEHREDWPDDRVLQALKERNPKFPPESASALQVTLPVDILYRYTGCRLQAKEAHLIVRRYQGPPSKVEVRWMVFGTVEDRDRTACSAEFDPFTGNLLIIH